MEDIYATSIFSKLASKFLLPVRDGIEKKSLFIGLIMFMCPLSHVTFSTTINITVNEQNI